MIVPQIGFGTWRLRGRDCERAVRDAIAAGYRHVDTARMYGNEEHVGRAIAGADVFVVTKLWPRRDLTRDGVRSATQESLAKLGRIDLLLIHWPDRTVPLAETLEAMTEERDAGRIAHIGVSNFDAPLLREAMAIAEVMCDQVIYNPFENQDAVLEVGAEVVAYTPLAKGRVARNRMLKAIGKDHGKTAAQVALRWLVQQPRVAAIPKASSPERIRENLDVFDFELSDDEMSRIAALRR